jgi:hypothetical protein
MKLNVGDRVKFEREKQRYTVQAASERFAVCTKPFNARKTVIYTIVDFKRNVRGTENLIFCMGFEDQQHCQDALQRLEAGESEVSYRNFIDLNIERVDAIKAAA